MISASTFAVGAAELRRGFEFVSRLFSVGVQNLHADVYEKMALNALVHRPSHYKSLLASDFEARQKSAELFLAELAAFYRGHRHDHSHTYMGTFAWDLGVSPISAPNIPVRAMRNRIDKLMRRHNLHGVYFLEQDIILRLPWESEPRIHTHVHMWCWQPGERLRPRLLGKLIRQTHQLSNDMGARSVVFTQCKLSPKGIVKLGAYLTKVPACVKQRRKKLKGKGYRLTHEQEKYSSTMALRSVEILSQLSIYECVGGVGEGTVVSRAWKRRLLAWGRAREQRWLSNPLATPVVTRDRARRLWRKLRRSGAIRWSAVTIDR